MLLSDGKTLFQDGIRKGSHRFRTSNGLPILGLRSSSVGHRSHKYGLIRRFEPDGKPVQQACRVSEQVYEKASNRASLRSFQFHDNAFSHCLPFGDQLEQTEKGFALKGLRWARDLQGEESIPAVFFLVQGAGRRPTDPDPDLDLLLAGLTVQAYRDAPPLDLFAAQLDDERFVLRWTAARILTELDPGHPALEKAARDEDPRVAQRAQPRAD